MGSVPFAVGCVLAGMFLEFLFGKMVMNCLAGLFLGQYVIPAVWTFFTGPRFDNRLVGR